MNHTINDLTEDYAPAVRDASRRVVSTARSNPIPLALIGLGVGILLINRFRSQRQTTSYRYDDGNDEYEQINADYDYTAGQGKSGVRQVYNKVGGAANSVYETASSAAGSAYEGVSGAANTAYQGVSSAAGTAYKQVGNLGNQTRKAARWTQETYADQFEANPLAIGAVALALGAVVGLALPTTQIEGEYLGEARNNILQQAQDKATEVFDKVQQVAGNVVEKAQQAAGSVVDQAQQAAGDVAQTVQDEVKAKGLTA